MSRGPRARRIIQVLTAMAVMLVLAATARWVARFQGAPERRPPRDVILIVIDTLRADHLPLYGYDRDTSPNLTALAREAVTFRRAVSPGTWTVPSHASMFTGLWPSFHGAERLPGPKILARPMRPDAPTLAEILKAHGFHTTAFIGNATFVTPSLGFGRGFDEFRNDELYFPPRLRAELSHWLPAQRERLFVFVNLLDPHEPYEPPTPLDTRFPTRHPEYGTMMTTLVHAGENVTPAMVEHFCSQYDGEIVLSDQALGGILKDLRQAARYDDALIIVTSDHGEFLGEHGLAGHGKAPHEPLVHVPLVVRFPGGWHGGEVVDRRVSTLTIFATVLTSLGIPIPPGAMVQTLDDPHPVWVEDADSAGNRTVAGYDADSKLLAVTTEQGTFTQLYDLAADPEENRPVKDETGAGPLREALMDFAAAPRPPQDQAAPQIDPEREAQLRKLGYIH